MFLLLVTINPAEPEPVVASQLQDSTSCTLSSALTKKGYQRLSFKIFPISTLIPRLQHKLLSNVCEVLSMCRLHTGSWLLFLKG
jgi:hypothetical protein